MWGIVMFEIQDNQRSQFHCGEKKTCKESGSEYSNWGLRHSLCQLWKHHYDCKNLPPRKMWHNLEEPLSPMYLLLPLIWNPMLRRFPSHHSRTSEVFFAPTAFCTLGQWMIKQTIDWIIAKHPSGCYYLWDSVCYCWAIVAGNDSIAAEWTY